jgi:4'-phosphopantetheinyl transferase EntD
MTAGGIEDAELRAVELKSRLGGRVLVASAPLTGELSDLFPEEQHVVERAVMSRVREFATGRVLARQLLRRLGFSDEPILPGRNRCPIWPAGATGSISHTGDRCVVAVALREDAAAIGIDVEPFAPLETELYRLVFVESELAWLRDQPSSQRPYVARALFSAKESYYKCQYPITERVLEFKDVEARVSVRRESFKARCNAAHGGARSLEGSVGVLSIVDDRIVTALMLAP